MMKTTPTQVLLLDQRARAAAAIDSLVSRPDCQLIVVDSVDAALAALRQGGFALVLVRAPLADGSEVDLPGRIREDGRIALLPVLFIVDDEASPAQIDQAYRCGAADVMRASACAVKISHKVSVFAAIHDERQRLAAAAAALDQALKVNELCAAMLAHDLRNPLTAVLAAAELLQRNPTPEVAEATARRLRSAGRRMQVMVDRLLYVARARAGTLELQVETVDLRALVQSIVDEFADAVGADRIRLAFSGVLKVVADAGAIGQILSNLIGNALRHGAAGGCVEVLLDGSVATQVRITIRNSGSLPDELKEGERWAQPMLQGGSGAGLGLYIVHQLVMLHHGSVEVSSDASADTCISVLLPRDLPASGAPAPGAVLSLSESSDGAFGPN